jgi:hypothetical protein
MKSTQLLSVVFSLIMFTGVTAGNAAFADSHDLDDVIEDFEDCINAGGVIGDNPDECTIDDTVFVNDDDDEMTMTTMSLKTMKIVLKQTVL